MSAPQRQSLEETAQLLAASIRTAHLASALAACDWNTAKEVHLLGLLHNAKSWLDIALPPGDDRFDARPAFLERLSWIDLDQDAVPADTDDALPKAKGYVRQALRILAGERWPDSLALTRDDLERMAAAARDRWLRRCGDVARLLPGVLAMIQQNREAEQVREKLLEDEKLASLAEFAAGAGHEINNPIAVICGRAQLLLQGEEHPQRRRDLAVIHSQAMRVHEMIADLMLFARPPKPDMRPIDVAVLVDDLLEEMGPLFQRREIEFCRWGHARPLPVLADGTQLLVALRAICDNALQWCRPGDRVAISARFAHFHQEESDHGRHEDRLPENIVPEIYKATGDEPLRDGANEPQGAVRIAICDTGPGLDEEVRRHLFDPFYSGRQAGRGLGMGLAKCWRIVKGHGGRIEANSRVGEGTEFVLTLPAKIGCRTEESD